MNEKPKRILRTMKWFIYPIMLWKLVYFLKMFNDLSLPVGNDSPGLLEKIDTGLNYLIIVVMVVGIFALLRPFFTNRDGSGE